jgi:hypothetical protein
MVPTRPFMSVDVGSAKTAGDWAGVVSFVALVTWRVTWLRRPDRVMKANSKP